MAERAASVAGPSGFLDTVREALAQAPVAQFDSESREIALGALSLDWDVLAVDLSPETRGGRDERRLGALRHRHHPRPVLRAPAPRAHRRTDSAEPGTFCWAVQAVDALLQLKAHAETALEAGLDHSDQDVLARQALSLRSAATYGVELNEGRDEKIAAKHRELARRLLAREIDYRLFAVDVRVPFENTAAEREIRIIGSSRLGGVSVGVT